MSNPCGSCVTFTIAGESHTVYLKKPVYGGEDNSISKDISKFAFWSGHYKIHDDGIVQQPLILRGVEFAACDEELGGFCFEGDGVCFPLCFNMGFTNKMLFIMEMSDNNEEVAITGLGSCMDAVYVIRKFSYKTLTPTAYKWTMSLEKVRGI